jgi:PQQ-like domain
MRWSRRLASVTGAAASVAAVLSFAAPANAAYTPQALTLPWTPAGAVHSSLASGNVVYLGGKLDGTGGIAAIDATTGNLLWMVPANNDVHALTLSPDGSTLYAGGDFSTVDGMTHRHLVAINVADHTVLPNWKAGAAGEVRDLVVYGSDLIVAGKITNVAGTAHRGIGAVNAATGKFDPAFNFTADDDVLGLAVTGTTLLLSGSFHHINGQTRNELASINMATNTLTGWVPAKLCSTCDQYWDVQTDGVNAYVGTSGFQGFLGAYNLATGRSAWTTSRGFPAIVSTDGDVQTLYLAGDGELYFGGHFAHFVRSSSGSGTQAAIDQGVVAAVFASSGLVDTAFKPRIYKTYPGGWAITGAAGKLWLGGDFGGEGIPTKTGTVKNNKVPYWAAYQAQ